MRPMLAPAYSGPESTRLSGPPTVGGCGPREGCEGRWVAEARSCSAGGMRRTSGVPTRLAARIQRGSRRSAPQPAPRGRVRDDSVRRVRPAEPEQLGEHGLARLNAAQLVLRVRAALIAEQESPPHHRATAPASRTARTSSASTPAPSRGSCTAARTRSSSSSSGRCARTWPPASTPWTMSASAPACAAALASSTLPPLVDPGRRREPPRQAPEGDDDVRLRGGAGIAGTDERQQQVDRDRTSGQPARRGDLVRGRSAHAADRPQPAGLRHRRGQLVPRHAAHAGLDDGDRDCADPRPPSRRRATGPAAVARRRDRARRSRG
jgi:hypothetical protein